MIKYSTNLQIEKVNRQSLSTNVLIACFTDVEHAKHIAIQY